MTISQHYVYRVTKPDTGEFYIGSRTVHFGSVHRDGYYLGSGRWPKQMRRDGVVLVKEILHTFEDVIESRAKEAALLIVHASNPLCRNRTHRSKSAQPYVPRPIKTLGTSALAIFCAENLLTLQTFGDLIGMSRSATHRIVRGQAYPMPETAKRIVEVTKGAVKFKDLYA